MKKILLAAFVLCGAALWGNALAVTNPLYMPEEGQLLFDAEAAFKDDSSGLKDSYFYKASVSYNTSDRLQLGGYVGYAYLSKETPKKKDFTNPGAFAYFRILDNIVKLDVGAESEFDSFDNLAEGGVADGANKYTGVLRAGADLKAMSFGAIGSVSYWDLDSNMGYGYQDMVNTDAKAFIIFDVFDVFGFGAEGGYKVFNAKRDDDWNSSYITARIDINPLPSRLGVLLYATAEDNERNPHTDFAFGLRAKLLI